MIEIAQMKRGVWEEVMEVTWMRQWSHIILWDIHEFDPASSGTRFSFKKIHITCLQLPHDALINKDSWADLGEHFCSLLWIRSLRPAIFLVGHCH